jgi:hypothetical protein
MSRFKSLALHVLLCRPAYMEIWVVKNVVWGFLVGLNQGVHIPKRPTISSPVGAFPGAAPPIHDACNAVDPCLNALQKKCMHWTRGGTQTSVQIHLDVGTKTSSATEKGLVASIPFSCFCEARNAGMAKHYVASAVRAMYPATSKTLRHPSSPFRVKWDLSPLWYSLYGTGLRFEGSYGGRIFVSDFNLAVHVDGEHHFREKARDDTEEGSSLRGQPQLG